MRILERMELDKPILMHDKLDIIWDGKIGMDEQSMKDAVNQYQVKHQLEKVKVLRRIENKKSNKGIQQDFEIYR